MGERAPTHIVIVREVSALTITAILGFLFSTILWIGIPVFMDICIADLVLAFIAALFSARIESLSAALTTYIATSLNKKPEKVSGIVAWPLRLLSLVAVYLGYKRIFSIVLGSIFTVW
ncbi:MAG: hypothetical protein QW731_01885, partial [Thermofilaceae archaeon]